MSRSWKDGALDGPRAPRYTRTKFKYVPEEEQEVSEHTGVFIIINEWTDVMDNTSSEVIGGVYFRTEDEAWDALDLIAQSHNVELDDDSTSFNLGGDKKRLVAEEYRIEELTHGG